METRRQTRNLNHLRIQSYISEEPVNRPLMIFKFKTYWISLALNMWACHPPGCPPFVSVSRTPSLWYCGYWCILLPFQVLGLYTQYNDNLEPFFWSCPKTDSGVIFPCGKTQKIFAKFTVLWLLTSNVHREAWVQWSRSMDMWIAQMLPYTFMCVSLHEQCQCCPSFYRPTGLTCTLITVSWRRVCDQSLRSGNPLCHDRFSPGLWDISPWIPCCIIWDVCFDLLHRS